MGREGRILFYLFVCVILFIYLFIDETGLMMDWLL